MSDNGQMLQDFNLGFKGEWDSLRDIKEHNKHD